jgi:rubrerythrin
MDFMQSRTYANLQTAFEFELESSTLLSISADRARQEDYQQIGNIYDTFARNNKEHARIWMRQLNGGTLPSMTELLQSDYQRENYAGNTMYREFARIAAEEGFTQIAALFNGVANIDLNHALTLRTQYENVVREEVFCKPREQLWICLQCGNILSGLCAPEVCPVCGFPQGYYRVYE